VDVSRRGEGNDDADRFRWIALATGDYWCKQHHYAHRERQGLHAVLLEYRFWKRDANVSPNTGTVKHPAGLRTNCFPCSLLNPDGCQSPLSALNSVSDRLE